MAGNTDRGTEVDRTRRAKRMTVTLLIPSRCSCSENRRYVSESCERRGEHSRRHAQGCHS